MRKFSDLILVSRTIGDFLKQSFRGIFSGTPARIHIPITVLKQKDSRFK
ncbi:MAG TPA: hypothetical protein VD884_01405 [Ohtaekwangia sp.]|nr:hypothetical protein [Ohtaekwangia sp.]